MIAKVVHGYRPAGLIHYLFGPGEHEEHRDPRVVATWDGAPWAHQPEKLVSVVLDGEVVQPGEFDFDLRPLAQTMQELAEHAGLPVRNPPPITPEWKTVIAAGGRPPAGSPWWTKFYKRNDKGEVELRAGYVWHCPVRLAPTDPILTDQQWEHIAQRLMTATGIHQAGCRWIAVRHADDHIHLMATLVSERTGRRFYPRRDWPKLRAECQRLENELGLVATPSADKTAVRQPTRREKGKAQRLGWELTAREQLQRQVAQCAAGAQDGEEFLAALRRDGLDPQTRLDRDGVLRGFSVAWPGDVTADGSAVRYGGSSLAADLSWPRLQARWATSPTPEPVPRTASGRVTPQDRRAVLEEATAAVEAAAAQLRGGTLGDADVEGIAHATGEVLASMTRGREGPELGPLGEVQARFDRATRVPHEVLPRQIGPVARDLRMASRRIAAVGALAGRGHEKFTLLALLLAAAGLAAEIAAWQQARGRVHQASAARRVARALPEVARRPTGGSRPGSPRPRSTPVGGARRDQRVGLRTVAGAGTPAARPRGPRPG